MSALSGLQPMAQTAWSVTVTAAVVSLATVWAWPIYDSPQAAWVAIAGFVTAALIALASAAWRWRWFVTAFVAVLAYLVLAVLVAMPSVWSDSRRALSALPDAAVGVVTGWKRLATVELPAGTYQAVLVPLLVTVFAGSLVALLFALRGGAAGGFAAAPLVAMAAFGPAFGEPDAGANAQLGALTVPAARHVALAVAVVGLILTWLVARSRLERASALRAARSRASTVRQAGVSIAVALRRQVSAAALAVVAIAAGVAVSGASDHFGPRTALRETVEPVVMLAAQPSPLSAYRAYFEDKSFDAPVLRIEGATAEARLRIATLDTYDGITFHVSEASSNSRFAREPGVQEADLTITIEDGFSGVWVPVVTTEGGAPRFSGARAQELEDAYYASGGLNGAVVVTDDAANGVGLLPGDSYQISAPTFPDSTDSFARSTGGEPLVTATQYPSLAAWVDSQELGRTGADLLELVQRLRARGYVSHASVDSPQADAWQRVLSGYEFEASRPGHGAARIDTLFSNLVDQQLRAGAGASDANLVAAVGDDEQFAPAAALLAQYLGFDSRVVIGIRLGTTDEGSPVTACVDVCTGANLTAWVEVRTPAGEWLAIDASPQYANPPIRIRQGEEPPKNPTVPQQQQADVMDPPAAQSDTAVENSTTDEEAPSSPRQVSRTTIVVVASAGMGVLAIVPFLILPLAKVGRRRWRRTAAVPEVSMVGAWAELLDTYADLGIDVPRRLTRGETADILERPDAVLVATIVDRAVFAEHPPTREACDATWQMVDAERRAVLSEQPWSRRLRALLTPTSLLAALRDTHTPHVSTHGLSSVSHVS